MGAPHPNQRPTIRLTQMPASTDTAGTYAYEISWAGFDADGRVVGFSYAVDPPGRADAETAWVKTTANRHLFVFRSDSVTSGSAIRARGYHTVAVKCEDDQDASSEVASASFTTTTVAPTVHIVSPVPHRLLSRAVAPAVRIEWEGDDADGIGSRRPVSYRWKLLSESSPFPVLVALADPDSLRRVSAPAFADWDSLGGDVTSVDLRDLVPGHEYVFVVVAIDQAGAYSPVFSLDNNMLRFYVSPAASAGPQISITAPSLSFTFPSGGFFTDPVSYVKVELPADTPIPVGWSAKPAAGGFIRGYRWALDLQRIDDETPRSDETLDLRHWSRFTIATGTTLPAFSPAGGRLAETHLFYLEARDDLGLLSLGVMQFTAVRPVFDHDLLIVDDTWFSPDSRGTSGCVVPPRALWPSAAELDTFLYAVGGNPYRCYPAGTRSPVGVFAGYEYDTLGAHFSPPGVLNLMRMDRYRNIIWMVDLPSAFTHTNSAFSGFEPEPLLREWCSPLATSPLATWMLQGGRLWLLGGGGAMASLIPYDAFRSPNNVFSASLGELGPGRIMFDDAHWRSEVRVLRSLRANRSPRAVGGWPGAPDYSVLPDVLAEKAPETDPLPPLRTANFYLSSYAAEHLSRPNVVVEHSDPDPAKDRPFSTLDTLYVTLGGQAGSDWPVMTLYHGGESPLFVFSGFPIWYFQRSQTIALVDFVLGRVWGLTRRPVPR